MSNNLTKKHRLHFKSYKDGEWETVTESENVNKFMADYDGKSYAAGPAIDRLHEFEKLGYEPEELEKIITKYQQWKRALNSVYGKINYQDTDSLSKKRTDMLDAIIYAYNKAGEIENMTCRDIRSMYPTSLFMKEGFAERFAMNEAFRKLVDERITRALNIAAPSKFGVKLGEIAREAFDHGMKSVYISTSGCDKNSPFSKKLDELISEWPKKNPFLTKKFNVPTKNTRTLTHIKRVIFNNPATIVFWADGDKTVVKCQNGEPYDPEKGLAMAISKKALGNDNKWYNEFKKQLKNYEEPEVNIEIEFDIGNLKKFADDFTKELRKFNAERGQTT